jgi:23S rRNA (pseudouridine1915-N3)-methyltransferase
MKLRIVWVGKTKQATIKELIEQYKERVARFAAIEVTELRDCTDEGADPKRILDRESAAILERVDGQGCLVVLDERGRQFDSYELAEFLQRHRVSGTRQLTFVIGGHHGLADAVRRRGDLVLGLSRMTFPHELARVLLLEQVYRAFTIIQELPYQK